MTSGVSVLNIVLTARSADQESRLAASQCLVGHLRAFLGATLVSFGVSIVWGTAANGYSVIAGQFTPAAVWQRVNLSIGLTRGKKREMHFIGGQIRAGS